MTSRRQTSRRTPWAIAAYLSKRPAGRRRRLHFERGERERPGPDVGHVDCPVGDLQKVRGRFRPGRRSPDQCRLIRSGGLVPQQQMSKCDGQTQHHCGWNRPHFAVTNSSTVKEAGECQCVAVCPSGTTKITHTATVKVECNAFVQQLMEDVQINSGAFCCTDESADVSGLRNWTTSCARPTSSRVEIGSINCRCLGLGKLAGTSARSLMKQPLVF